MTLTTHTARPADLYRLLALCDELAAGCDPDFDAARDDLDREFQELRLHLGPLA